ncbi:MAG TPA: hypothetical protein VGS22_22960 [Thermoanaerobaculia bacterium]|jgi:hypothetical protein|nr:hypothetical protein [Thermoanaerobaculia bacterium]
MRPKAAGSLRPVCLVALALLLPTWVALDAQGANPQPSAPAQAASAPAVPAPPAAAAAPIPPPKVVNLQGNLELDDLIQIQVDHLAEWSKTNDPGKLVPYISGRAIRGNFPDEIEPARGMLSYHLELLPENREIWTDLLGAPSRLRHPVTLSVGLEGEAHSSFDTVYDLGRPVLLTVISPWYGLIAVVLTLVTMFLLLWLARTTNLIRETGPTPTGGRLRPYNLGRTQMAFWFFLVFVSYLGIWLITGSLDTITASLLALMGISAGTALSEALIDSGKDGANAAQLQDLSAEKQALEQGLSALQAQAAGLSARPDLAPDELTNRDSLNRQVQDSRTRLAQVNQQVQALTPTAASGVTRGFLLDLLADSSGYSFHRFQIFAWTILLGIMFVSSVYNDLTMPEFSPTLLGLMGISSGTYIGFKFPEQK